MQGRAGTTGPLLTNPPGLGHRCHRGLVCIPHLSTAGLLAGDKGLCPPALAPCSWPGLDREQGRGRGAAKFPKGNVL